MSNLSNTSFSDTFLSGANLSGTNLFRADLLRTKLSHTNLYHAYLIEVKNLTFSQLKSACHWEQAFYKGYFDYQNKKWIIDKKANQQYIKQVKQDKNSDPKKPVDCSFWK